MKTVIETDVKKDQWGLYFFIPDESPMKNLITLKYPTAHYHASEDSYSSMESHDGGETFVVGKNIMEMFIEDIKLLNKEEDVVFVKNHETFQYFVKTVRKINAKDSD